MNTKTMSEACERFWDPVLPWGADSPATSPPWSGTSAAMTEVQFVDLELSLHSRDMTSLAGEFTQCVHDVLFGEHPG